MPVDRSVGLGRDVPARLASVGRGRQGSFVLIWSGALGHAVCCVLWCAKLVCFLAVRNEKVGVSTEIRRGVSQRGDRRRLVMTTPTACDRQTSRLTALSYCRQPTSLIAIAMMSLGIHSGVVASVTRTLETHTRVWVWVRVRVGDKLLRCTPIVRPRYTVRAGHCFFARVGIFTPAAVTEVAAE